MDNITNLPQEPSQTHASPQTLAPAPAEPSPASPEIKVRTMHEDLAAAPSGPTEPPPDEPLFTPETVNNLGGSMVEGEHASRRPLVIGIIVGVIVLVGLGYFVLYPRLAPKGPVAEPPANVAPPTAPSPVAHVSALVRSPAAIADVALGSLNVAEIRAGLRDEGQRVLSEGSFKEVNVSVNGVRPDAADYFGALLTPVFDAAALRSALDRDFTALLYYDRNGAWPVYIVKGTLASGGLEADSLIKNLYLDDPGAFQPWKDGAIGAYATRYAVASASGASFNYGAFGDHVILSTSFNALKAVLPLLGL